MKRRWGEKLKPPIRNTKPGARMLAVALAGFLVTAPAPAWAAASTSVDAVQELKVENAALRAKDKDLEARIEKLEKKMRAPEAGKVSAQQEHVWGGPSSPEQEGKMKAWDAALEKGMKAQQTNRESKNPKAAEAGREETIPEKQLPAAPAVKK